MVINFLLKTAAHVWQIFINPWVYDESLWMILPLILILILIHLYFGRHRSEELGWNSAFGNSISLLWICVILLKLLLDKYTFAELISQASLTRDLILIGILVLWVLLLLIFNFFHVLPKKFAFTVSSSDATYVLAYIIISLVVADSIISWSHALASVIVFAIMVIGLQLLKHIIPMTSSSKQVLKRREKREAKKKRKG